MNDNPNQKPGMNGAAPPPPGRGVDVKELLKRYNVAATALGGDHPLIVLRQVVELIGETAPDDAGKMFAERLDAFIRGELEVMEGSKKPGVITPTKPKLVI